MTTGLSTLPLTEAQGAIVARFFGTVDAMCDLEMQRLYPSALWSKVDVPGGAGTSTQPGNENRGIFYINRQRPQANFEDNPITASVVGNSQQSGDFGGVHLRYWPSLGVTSINAQTISDFATEGNTTNGVIGGTHKARAYRQQMIATEFEERLLDYTTGPGALGVVDSFDLGAGWVSFTNATAFDIWKRLEGVDQNGNAAGRNVQFRNGAYGAMRAGGAQSYVQSPDTTNRRVYFGSLPPDLAQGDYCYRYNSQISTGAIPDREAMLGRYTLAEWFDGSITEIMGLDYAQNAAGQNLGPTNANNFGAITPEGFIGTMTEHLRRMGAMGGKFVSEWGFDTDLALRAAMTAQNGGISSDGGFGLVASFKFTDDRSAISGRLCPFVKSGTIRVLPDGRMEGTPAPMPEIRQLGEISGTINPVMVYADGMRWKPNAPDGRVWKSDVSSRFTSAQFLTMRNLAVPRRDALLEINGITTTPTSAFTN